MKAIKITVFILLTTLIVGCDRCDISPYNGSMVYLKADTTIKGTIRVEEGSFFVDEKYYIRMKDKKLMRVFQGEYTKCGCN